MYRNSSPQPRTRPYPESQALYDDNTDLIALWCLRILVRLGGQKGFVGPMGLRSDHVLEAIGLAHLADAEFNQIASIRRLRQRLMEVEAKRPEPAGILAENLAHAAEVLGLTETDRLLLAFATLMNSSPGLDDAGDTLGQKLTDERFAQALSVILGVPLEAVQQSLSPRGVLIGAGLCLLDHDPERLAVKLRFAAGFGGALQGRHQTPEDLFAGYLGPGGECRLSLEDYPHLGSDLALLRRILEWALERGERGCNILLHGPSGTGKTQLARALAGALGAQLYEVLTEGTMGDRFPRRSPRIGPLEPEERIAAYRLSQHILARRPRCLVVFDEIEDVFPVSPWDFLRQSHPPKAWLNELLETNPVPALWVSNRISQLDPAVIRRFSLVIEVGHPTRAVRRRMLQQALGESGVDPGWLDRIADHEHLPPALIEQAGRRATAMTGESPEILEQTLERLLGNTVQAMGHPLRVSAPNQGLMPYRLDCLNPDEDLDAIAEGLRRDPRGRFCLYGPPGTGKSAFGDYLARTLDRPLLLKRGSDLLSKWVGETEQHIARMFREAEREGAVLLLDEADSFLQERTGAHHRWEVTQVNELLTRMEAFGGLFIAATNLIDTLDVASLRRFDLKVCFDYLRPAQAWVLFREVLTDRGRRAPTKRLWLPRLESLDALTPGDFATAVRRQRLSPRPLTAERLFILLEKEVAFKRSRPQRGIGFTAEV